MVISKAQKLIDEDQSQTVWAQQSALTTGLSFI